MDRSLGRTPHLDGVVLLGVRHGRKVLCAADHGELPQYH